MLSVSKAAIAFAIAFLAVLVAMSFVGCTAKINGGGATESDISRDENTDVRIAVTPEGAVAGHAKGRQFAATQQSATTQPSVSGPADLFKHVGLSGAEGIGAVDFQGQARKTGSLWLGFGLLAAAIVFFYIGKPVAGFAMGGAGILSYIWPDFLALIAVGAIGVALFTIFRETKIVKQIVAGVEQAKEKLTPDLKDKVNEAMATAQDDSTQARVKKVKATL